MTKAPSSPEDPAAASLAAAVRRAEESLAELKAALDEGEGGEISHKVAAAAAALVREGEHLIEQNEVLKGARQEVTGTIRKNPLAAVGVAFGAGLLLALLARR
jgi:ElaB/YqjD/DUF883 family membrane-anchored ribosome-binding protein